MDIIEIAHCSICGKETHLCKCGVKLQPGQAHTHSSNIVIGGDPWGGTNVEQKPD